MKNLSNMILILLTSVMISACGGGGGGDVDTISSSDVSTTTGTVQQKIDLSWSAPATRTDGSSLSLSELVGYKVYYGTDPDALQLQEEVVGVSETSISITDLSPGIYYFAVTAYDVDGLESSFSEVVSKEISS